MIDCSKAEIYLHEKNRLTKASETGVCRISCEDCPLSENNNNEDMSCWALELKKPQTAISIMSEWSNSHEPKTYLSELLLHFPNITLGDDGVPSFCPHCLGMHDIPECKEKNSCLKCWDQIID